MKNYTVYFEIYGKKMKAKMLAESRTDAQARIKNKITFHKVVEDSNNELDFMLDFLGLKKKL